AGTDTVWYHVVAAVRWWSSCMSFWRAAPRPPSCRLFPYTALFRSVLPRSFTGPQSAGQGRKALFFRCFLSPRRFAPPRRAPPARDRKSTRLNSSHVKISYAVSRLKKKTRLETLRHDQQMHSQEERP